MCANAVLFKWHNRKTDYADGRELISPKSKEEENELEGEHSSAATAARGESVFIPALGLRETPRSNAVHHSRRRLVNSIKLWAGMCEYFKSFHLCPRAQNSIHFSCASKLTCRVVEIKLEDHVHVSKMAMNIFIRYFENLNIGVY